MQCLYKYKYLSSVQRNVLLEPDRGGEAQTPAKEHSNKSVAINIRWANGLELDPSNL